jgi:hypothetical protein
MRIFHFLAILALVIVTSCRTLPKLFPLTSQEKSYLPVRCQSLFLKSEHQLTHSIEATLPGGGKTLLMGLLVVSPESGAFESVIMTIEGVVIFQARYEKGQTKIKRGVSYFKSTEFAAGLVNDIKLIFFKPKGALIEIGKSDTGFPVCRYREKNNRLVELILKENTWEIREYNRGLVLSRTVRLFLGERISLSASGTKIPRKIQLTAHDPFGYSLTLKRIGTTSK